MVVFRGDVYMANLEPVVGSEQGGFRPVVIIQNNIGNKYSPTTIIAAVTSKVKASLPTHINVGITSSGLVQESCILLEQVRTIDKTRLRDKLGSLSSFEINLLDTALRVSFDI